MAEAATLVVTVVLFLSCFLSFAWAMRYFFVVPGRKNREMTGTAVAGVIGVLLQLICFLVPGALTPARGLVAGSLYVLCLCLFWATISANRKRPLSAAFATDLPVHIVQHGPYRFIRHPFYTSYLLAWTAGYVASANPLAGLVVLVMIVLYLRASGVEERKFALSAFAGAYESYRESTGRFVPNLRKLLASQREVRQRSHEAA